MNYYYHNHANANPSVAAVGAEQDWRNQAIEQVDLRTGRVVKRYPSQKVVRKLIHY